MSPTIEKNLNAPESLYPGYLSSGSINSSVLAPTPTINYQTPETKPVYPVASLTVPELKATQPEQQANDLSSRLRAINDALAGKAADTTSLYKSQGFGTTTDVNGNIIPDAGTADLTAKLTALQNEAQAIPLQIQQDFKGRGTTTGGVQPLQTESLRNNAIAALGVSSIIAAKNGQLETARHYVEQALTEKYGPLEAEYKAKSANLQLILNSPAYSVADKNRAQQQQALLDEEKAQRDQARQSFKDAQAAVISIVGANRDLKPDQLGELQRMTDPLQVAEFAAKNGLIAGTDKLPASAQEYLFVRQNGYKGTYNDYQNEDANRKRSIAAAGVANESGLNPKQVTIFNGIVDKYNKSPLVAANDRAVILKDVTNAVAADPSNASLQVSFIYSMIQALDTYQSAVREGEIGLISGTQGLGDKLQNMPSKIQNGTPLSANKVAEYVATAKLLTDSINNAALKKQQSFSSQAKIAGVGPAFDEFTQSTSVQPTKTSPVGKEVTAPDGTKVIIVD